MSASPSSQPVPGTVLLVDLAGTLNVKHRDGGGKEASDIVLLPQPTSDVNDPLNWSRRRKLCNALILFAYVISANMMACLLSSALLLIEKDTGIKLEDLNTGTSIEFLFFGWSNVLWQPLALHFGRRPVLLFTMLVMVTCSVWTPFVTSTGEWYVNRFLLGFFYGPVETLMEICLSDTRFVHERGFWVGLYTWILLGSTFLASAPAGYIAEDLGWEWIQFIAAMMGMATFFIIFFFWDETMFYREREAPEMMAGSCESRKPTSPVADEAAPIPEKRGSSMKHSQDASSTEMSSGDVSMVPKPYIQRLKFWGSRHPNQPNHLFQSMWMPFYLARFPAIVGSAFVVGAVLSWYTVLSGTTALILSAEPYNFSAKSTGVFLVSGFIGCSVGCVLAAPSANRLAVWLSRRNAGVFEPEYRLWTAIALMILHPTGCILVGVGANHCIHWVGIAFGVAMIVACFSIGSTLAINYIMDCYGEVASDGLVTMGCIRNLIGFAFGYGITPWINATGVQDTYIAIGFIGMALYGVPLIFVWCGKSLREKTAAAYWRTIERNGYVAH